MLGHEPSFRMHVILDYVVDQKFSAIEALEDELDTVEAAMLAGVGGMSEWSMMTGPENWRITFGNYYLLKWLEKRSQRRERQPLG